MERDREIVEAILAARRRRMEASGEPYEQLPSVDLTGCNSIGDQITRARRAKMERQEKLEELAEQTKRPIIRDNRPIASDCGPSSKSTAGAFKRQCDVTRTYRE